MIDATRSLSPLSVTGTFSLTSEDLLAAFSQALEAGHEDQLRLAFKIFVFWELLKENERAGVINSVFELVRAAKEQSAPAKLDGTLSAPVPKKDR